MARIKINRLPAGFKLVNGKIEEDQTMKDGGYVTGDQFDYGLVTTPQGYYSNTNFNDNLDDNVRYSLSGVPKDKANIEAEGGETVLTDLANDGRFGLYDIKGPRHSKGGVPMFLPEQSFIYSDTDKMKFTKDEMAEFGIESKNKKTPASLSKKYDLNKYYGSIEDQFADDIQVRSAELMLNKNMNDLSKLAFVQESKKKFEDGVPLAAHPYLIQQGVDPIEFTAQVEQITREQAQMNAIAALPPEQQEQLMMLQQMMAQADQQQMQGQPQGQQPMEEVVEDSVVMDDMARYGKELSKAQFGKDFIGSMFPPSNLGVNRSPNTMMNGIDMMPRNFGDIDFSKSTILDWDNDGVPNTIDSDPFGLRGIQEVTQQAESYGTPTVASTTGNGNKKPTGNNVAFDQSRQDRYTKDWGITFNDDGVGSTSYSDVQGYQGDGYFGGASENIEGWKETNADYPGMEALVASLSKYGDKTNPEVQKYQKWFNEVSIPKQVAALKAERERVGKKFTDEDVKNATAALIKDYGFKKGTGTDYDGKMGTWTSSRRPFTYKLEETPEEKIAKEEKEERDPIDVVIPEEYQAPRAEWWRQDQNNLMALGLTDDKLYLPWAPDAERVKMDYVLDDWRGAANANTAVANTMTNALGAVGGPQAVANSQIQGQTLNANAQAINRVNTNNVGIMNQVAAMQPQLDMAINGENARRQMGVYDGTQKTLQGHDNFLNWKTGKNAELQNAALTNRANTYNLNSIYDNYAVNPTSGGMINFTNPNALKKVGPQPDRQKAFLDAYTELRKNLPPDQKIDENMMTLYMGLANNTTPDMRNAQAEMQQKGMPISYPTSSSKGKEIKRMVVPFYTGKMGY